jgi:NAD(P)-dependent dehydrogenase (short-subunit alcohol dehydrogenase family)
MNISGRVVVVTGGAGGIGSALSRRFAAEGARGVIVADRDGPAAQRVAAGIVERGGRAIGVAADVGTEAGNVDLLRAAEAALGPVDIFFANAGVAGGGVDASDAVWDLQWRVNVMAHVWAARHLLPGWLARGEGYFLSTASMAGLLTSVGDGVYSATKHAAVGWAEFLAYTYRDQGVRVSCLCPGGVDTPMLTAATGGDAAKAAALIGGGAVRSPDEVADTCVEAIRDERFLILSHPEMQDYMQRKAGDTDRWIRGMTRLWARGKQLLGTSC